jgi:molecular chaperone DnaK (HSP70)
MSLFDMKAAGHHCMQGTIVILHGDGPKFADKEVLGQLDLECIPPAPAQVPRIRVTLSLDASMQLHASVCDLDTKRQKVWQMHGKVDWIEQAVVRR